MIKTRAIKYVAICICIGILLATITSCQKAKTVINTGEEKMQYMMFMFTNKSYATIEDYLPEMKQLYGDMSIAKKKMYAFGVVGPMVLTQSIEEMQTEVNTCFDYAEKYQIPVYFQMDDLTNYSTAFGSGAEKKFYEDPLMCEWTKFPEAG